MDEGAPLGVESPIRPCGVFPLIEGRTESEAEAAEFYARTADGLIYKSALEEAEWVQGKLDAMVDDESMIVFASLDDARRALGDVIVNKLACLVKDLPDGGKKWIDTGQRPKLPFGFATPP